MEKTKESTENEQQRIRFVLETLATKEEMEEHKLYTERYATLAETEEGWQRMNDLVAECK